MPCKAQAREEATVLLDFYSKKRAQQFLEIVPNNNESTTTHGPGCPINVNPRLKVNQGFHLARLALTILRFLLHS